MVETMEKYRRAAQEFIQRQLDQDFYSLYGEEKMIALEPGTILEKEYKGNKIKVKVLKSGNYSFNGKEYEDRGSLMKAVAKGKTAQFTTFFGLGKDKQVKSKKAKSNGDDTIDGNLLLTDDESEENSNNSIDIAIRKIVRQEIKSFFRGKS